MSYEHLIECPPTIREGALITFIGESPGGQEVNWHECPSCGFGVPYAGKCKRCEQPRVHKPQGFVGGSGNLLRKACGNAGIDFSLCSRSNVSKRRPPGDKFDVFYLDKKRSKPTDELLWWRQLLIAEVTRYRPNVVVAAGNEALRTLCPGHDGITKWHGSILISDVVPRLKVIPVLHPAYIMRDNWEWYYILIRQLKRIKVESTVPHVVQKEDTDVFVIDPSVIEVIEFLDFIGSSKLPWTLDVETVGSSLRCFGLSSYARPQYAMCVPIQRSTGAAWSVVEESHIWRALSRAMRDNPLLENQNILYDLEYLLDFGCEPGGINFDPMTAMNVAYPEFDKGLDFTTMLYTFYPYYKDEGKTWNKKEPDEKTFTYNCKDMVATPKVSKGVKQDLASARLVHTYEERVRKFLPIGLEMQRNRLRLDLTWHKQLSDYLAYERQRKQQQLNELVGRELNVKSTPAVAALLYEELRLPVKHKRGTDSVTTDENTLRELRSTHPNVPQLNLILEVRHLRTKESNYIYVDFDIDPDGEHYLGYMARVSFAKTGRWSYSQSPKWRGSSPQTIPKIMRLMYCPPQGSCFWQRDLSQAEARIVAWLSDCKFLLDVFASPIKIHKVVGAGIFRKKPEEIESDSLEYDVSKRIVHAYNYMMQAKKLAVTANIPLDFAQYTYDNYGIQVPEVAEWHKEIRQTAFSQGRLITPMGRVRQLYKGCGAIANTGQLPDEILRDLVSYIPQATVPDILNEAMFTLWNTLPWVKFHQQGHDSFLASGPPDRTQEFYERSEEAADRVRFTIKGRDCHIPGEFQWGYLWGAMLSYKPGEDTSYEAWKERATREGFFKAEKIKERLYSMI